jgi:hypothetical protein
MWAVLRLAPRSAQMMMCTAAPILRIDRPELRIPNAAAQTRMVSGGEFWPSQRELSQHLNYMARARIFEFESSAPVNAHYGRRSKHNVMLITQDSVRNRGKSPVRKCSGKPRSSSRPVKYRHLRVRVLSPQACSRSLRCGHRLHLVAQQFIAVWKTVKCPPRARETLRTNVHQLRGAALIGFWALPIATNVSTDQPPATT